MALYAVGDIQGCFTTLQQLLQVIDFQPDRDKLWLVGDLVNRGPDSLRVLRWARDLGDAVTAVLGNHDLHLLARAAGVAEAKKRDTLDEVLAAADLPELMDWLRSRPLLHREGAYLMLHAGLLPQWTAGQALRQARQVEGVLRGPEWRQLLAAHAKGEARDPDTAAQVAFLGVVTRLRTCTVAGVPCSSFSGTPADAPPGCLPWFRVPGRQSTGVTCVVGHWAALGLRIEPGLIALDSGCVWGRELTAVRLGDGAVFQVPAASTSTKER
jgi:bis(5'-nucleosyl)-tetraphosphatase (symmetrical)